MPATELGFLPTSSNLVELGLCPRPVRLQRLWPPWWNTTTSQVTDRKVVGYQNGCFSILSTSAKVASVITVI